MHSHEYIKDYLIKIINQKDESSSIFYTFNMFLLNSNNNKIIFKVLYHIKNLVFLVFFFKF